MQSQQECPLLVAEARDAAEAADAKRAADAIAEAKRPTKYLMPAKDSAVSAYDTHVRNFTPTTRPYANPRLDSNLALAILTTTATQKKLKLKKMKK